MHRLIRVARGAAIALGLVLVIAAPAAAARPTRSVYLPQAHTDVAGTACAFDVDFSPTRGFNAYTDFSDGSEQHIANVDVTLTNHETGATFVHRARFNDTSWYDAATNQYHGWTSGQVLVQFFPGDLGPDGIVQYPGALYRFVGTQSYTWDANVNAYTQLSYVGTVTDVCALLAEPGIS